MLSMAMSANEPIPTVPFGHVPTYLPTYTEATYRQAGPREKSYMPLRDQSPDPTTRASASYAVAPHAFHPTPFPDEPLPLPHLMPFSAILGNFIAHNEDRATRRALRQLRKLERREMRRERRRLHQEEKKAIKEAAKAARK